MCWFQPVMAIIIISGSLHSVTFETIFNKINVTCYLLIYIERKREKENS